MSIRDELRDAVLRKFVAYPEGVDLETLIFAVSQDVPRYSYDMVRRAITKCIDRGELHIDADMRIKIGWVEAETPHHTGFATPKVKRYAICNIEGELIVASNDLCAMLMNMREDTALWEWKGESYVLRVANGLIYPEV